MSTLPYPKLPPGDFGFGSAYERVALYGKINRWVREWHGEQLSGLEGFFDSFAGLPGLHLLPLAQAGGRVTVACQSEQARAAVEEVYKKAGLASRLETTIANRPGESSIQKHDIVFLFNPFPFVEDWDGLLRDSAGLASRYLVVSVCSRVSYGIVFRRILQKIKSSSGEGLNLFEHPTSDPAFFRGVLAQYGTILEEDFFDAPWWPDFYGGPGDTVLTWLLKQFGWKPRPKPASQEIPPNHAYGPQNFPYAAPDDPELKALSAKISRHPAFDSTKISLLKAFFAHHRIFVVRRDSAA